ncbi:SUMF1/EgtB/PvdO family nonheme iron enzyme [bacterium]|nr:SUMF1/EgtB/PvdO family nonheme iron enzyme [bacterium]
MRFSILLLSLLVIFVGCGDDDPVAPPITTVTISVEIIPEELEASWELTGPNEYSNSGIGDIELAGLEPGGYEISYGFVDEYITPESEQKNLSSGDEYIFSGNYVGSIGTIQIDAEPNELNAPWIVTAPNGEEITGNGDDTLTVSLMGEYTISWSYVEEWNTPTTDSQILLDGETITFTGTYNPISVVNMIEILAGSFVMGSPTDEPGRNSNETEHTVTLTTDFFMSATEVTNQQYADLAQWAYNNGYCSSSSSSLTDNLDGSTQELLDLDDTDCEISFSGSIFSVDAGKENHPVMEVTWYGSVAFCDWLSLQEGLTRAYDHSNWQCNSNAPYQANGYRLPTEAEWEYACRASTTTAFNTGDCLDAGTEANYRGSYPQSGCPSGPYEGWTVPVASYPANSLGLYDMHGNLYEWCNDWYDSYSGDITDPVGASSGSYRVFRGGFWGISAQYCRSANRRFSDPGGSSYDIGFRFVRSTGL